MTKSFDEIDKYLERMIFRAEKRVVRIYARAFREVREEIMEMYEKYASGGSLTLADMTKYHRLERQLTSINEILIKVYGEVEELAQTTMEEQFLENYFRTAFLLEFETQQKLGFGGGINPTVIETALANPISGLTLSQVLEKNRTAIIYRVQQEITQGLVLGESYQEMARRMRRTFDGDVVKSQRVARTEAGRAQTIGRLESIEQAEKYTDRLSRVWDATLDSRTRPRHQTLDGQKADKDGYFHSRGAKAKGPHLWGIASMDINCRCDIRIEVDGRNPVVRRSRIELSNDHRRRTVVIPYTTYDEWYNSRVLT